MTVVISPKKLLTVLTAIVVSLIAAHIITQSLKYGAGHDTQLGLLRLFDLNEENNLPTWYSSSALLLCSLFLVVIGLIKKREHDRYAVHWLALSAIFLFLSLDEAASIHEIAIAPLRRALPRYTSGYLYFAWVIPGSVFVLGVGALYLRFLIDLPHRTRRQFLLGGALYVGGALGVELFEGKYAADHGLDNLTIWMIVALEEGCEMFGIVTFLYALSSYMSRHMKEIVLQTTDAMPERLQTVPAPPHTVPDSVAVVERSPEEKSPIAATRRALY